MSRRLYRCQRAHSEITCRAGAAPSVALACADVDGTRAANTLKCQMRDSAGHTRRLCWMTAAGWRRYVEPKPEVIRDIPPVENEEVPAEMSHRPCHNCRQSRRSGRRSRRGRSEAVPVPIIIKPLFSVTLRCRADGWRATVAPAGGASANHEAITNTS
jgi:hypothetical protein